MLAKKFRLPIGASLIKKQKSLRGNYFFLKKTWNDLSYSRFGVVVSGRTEKSAVRRNRIKRMIFDFVRKRKLYQSSGSDFLLIVQKSINGVDEGVVETELNKILSLNG